MMVTIYIFIIVYYEHSNSINVTRKTCKIGGHLFKL